LALLSAFYDWTSAVWWGTQPTTIADELFWLAVGLVTAVTIVTVAVVWLRTWLLAPAMMLAIFAAIVLAFVPIKHAQRFAQCETREQIITIHAQERKMLSHYCRTRTTLDSNWSAWQWHSGTVK
jgi:hypothetical protein